MAEWPMVSVVFVTYNRLQTLRPTFDSFVRFTDYPRARLQLIVTDDGSPEPVQGAIRAMPFGVHVFGGKGGDLGANQNRGIAAASGDYVLHLQDDLICHGPPDYLRRAVMIMEGVPEIGMVVLNQYFPTAPVREVRQVLANEVTIYVNDPGRQIKAVGQHPYTDRAHLKRMAFVRHIGPYKERVPMWESELDYSQRVNAQTKYFVGDVDGLNVFEHIGAELSFNTGNLNARLGRQLDKLPFGRTLLRSYQALKQRVMRWT
jgi:glycosyltransferase involved in cell wall biosynthesis